MNYTATVTIVRARRAAIHLLAAALAVGPLLAWVPVTRACTLDGIASLSVDGVTASLTSGRPTQATLASWAPFTLLTQGSGDPLHLAEDLGKVRQSLPAAALRLPFRWTFGDGAVAYGYAVTHRYARPGRYTITVSYEWPAQGRWVVFDTAEQPIVAAGDVWRANLGYYLDKAALFALRAAVWGVALVVLGAAVWGRVRRQRGGAEEDALGDSFRGL
jgi:hypothetical protein